MKFTIDTENNKILFNEPFTIEDLQHVLSLINIDGVEEWKVDMADDYLNDRPNDTITYPQPHWTYFTDNTGSFRFDGDTMTTTGEISFNNTTNTTAINNLDTIYN